MSQQTQTPTVKPIKGTTETFLNPKHFIGKWKLRNGREIEIVNEYHDLLLKVGSIHVDCAVYLWDMFGESRMSREFDLMERKRGAEGETNI